MRTSFLVVSSCALWSVAAASAAQPAPAAAVSSAVTFTVGEAVEEALARHPDLVALRRQFEAAAERPAQERFLAPPMAELQAWQWPINTINPANTNMYMFMAGQEIPGPGKRQLREAVLRKEADRVHAEIAIRAREVAAEVKRSYAAIVLARRAVEVHHASEDLIEQLAETAQARYASGRTTQGEVVRALLALSRIQNHLVELSEAEQIAMARLNTLMDRDPQRPIGPLGESRERVLLATPEALQRLALAAQPALTAARIDVERGDANVAVAASEARPDFVARAGYMLMPRERDAWTASIGITWPTAPWSRGRIDARRAEAAAELEAARAGVRAAENASRLAVHEAYVRVKAAERRAALLRTAIVPQSTQAVDVARVAYENDRESFENMLESEQTRIDTTLEYYEALRDLDLALADLEWTVGTELAPEWVGAAGNPLR